MSLILNETKQAAIVVVKEYNTTQTKQGAEKSMVCNKGKVRNVVVIS